MTDSICVWRLRMFVYQLTLKFNFGFPFWGSCWKKLLPATRFNLGIYSFISRSFVPLSEKFCRVITLSKSFDIAIAITIVFWHADWATEFFVFLVFLSSIVDLVIFHTILPFGIDISLRYILFWLSEKNGSVQDGRSEIKDGENIPSCSWSWGLKTKLH